MGPQTQLSPTTQRVFSTDARVTMRTTQSLWWAMALLMRVTTTGWSRTHGAHTGETQDLSRSREETACAALETSVYGPRQRLQALPLTIQLMTPLTKMMRLRMKRKRKTQLMRPLHV